MEELNIANIATEVKPIDLCFDTLQDYVPSKSKIVYQNFPDFDLGNISDNKIQALEDYAKKILIEKHNGTLVGNFKSILDSFKALGFTMTAEFFSRTLLKTLEHPSIISAVRQSGLEIRRSLGNNLIYYHRIIPRQPIKDLKAINDVMEQHKAKLLLEKALEKQQEEKDSQKWDTEYTISKTCPECGSEIRFPENTTDTEHGKTAHGVYSSVWADIQNGTYFCAKCNQIVEKQNGWRLDKLTEALQKHLDYFIKDVKSGSQNLKTFSIPKDRFCKLYRYRKDVVNKYQVQKMLRKLFNDKLDNFFLDTDWWETSEDTIKLYIEAKKRALV